MPLTLLAAASSAGVFLVTAVASPVTPPPAAPAACPSATTVVSTASALTSALKAAKAGTHIQLQPGTYKGKFVLSASGTASAPIYVCGPTSAVLDAGSIKS